METRKWRLWFDGSCQPCNPGGHACGGWLVRDERWRLVASGSEHFLSGDRATNNVAEYLALLSGLIWLHDRRRDGLSLTIMGDSKLVISQVADLWQCKHPRLRDLRTGVLSLLQEMRCRWAVKWVPREQNKEADELSVRAGRGLPEPLMTDAQRRQMWAMRAGRSKKR